MSRTLILLFRRDPSRDRNQGEIQFQGYEPLWPDGRRVAVGMDAFCKHGIRLLGLGKHLTGCQEKLVKMVCLPLEGREDSLNRIPGYRVRRFYVLRTGNTGRIHFMDGTPTVANFEIGIDEPRVIHWLGLNLLNEGEMGWFDLAAVELETPVAQHRPRLHAVEA